MPPSPFQRRFEPGRNPRRPSAVPASPEPVVSAPPADASVPEDEPAPLDAGLQVEEVPVEEVPAADLIERRHFVRTIPVADVKECDEEESWAIWSQWSNL